MPSSREVITPDACFQRMNEETSRARQWLIRRHFKRSYWRLTATDNEMKKLSSRWDWSSAESQWVTGAGCRLCAGSWTSRLSGSVTILNENELKMFPPMTLRVWISKKQRLCLIFKISSSKKWLSWRQKNISTISWWMEQSINKLLWPHFNDEWQSVWQRWFL